MANKARISATVIISALAIALPFIQTEEGNSLKSYEDVAGVWTICHGITQGITQGVEKTKAECDALTKNAITEFMAQVSDSLKITPTPELLAAHTSFAYNIGINGYRGSQTLKLTNAGKAPLGCQAMANWYTAAGKDCRLPKSNCTGLISRRHDEIKLCLSGVE